MDLFGKIVDLFLQKCGLLLQNREYFKQNYGFLNKIVDLLFREGGSSAPREPPGYRPAINACMASNEIIFILIQSCMHI